MNSLIVCPECGKQVAVPSETHETARVQCPLCDAQFELASAIPEDVPQLTIVDPGLAPTVEQPAGTEATAGGELELGLTDLATDDGSAALAFQPFAEDDEQKGEDAFGSVTFEKDTGTEAAAEEDEDAPLWEPAAVAEQGAEQAGEQGAEQAGEDGELGLAPEEAEQEQDTAHAGFDFGADEDDAAAGDFATAGAEMAAATATAPRKKTSKGPGVKGQILGVVIFGIIGLGLGYGILKMIKPAAAKPIDKMIEPVWSSVASLWSSGEDETGDGVDSSGDGSGSDEFQIGGMLPGQGEAAGAETGDQDNKGKGKKRKPPKKKKGPDDDALAAADTTDGVGGIDIDDQDLWRPGDDTPAAKPSLPFSALLGGMPDSEGVLKNLDADKIASAVTKAHEKTTAAEGKLAPIYFAMCDLGDQIAFSNDASSQRVEDTQSDAEDLMRQVANPGMYDKLNAFSYQWMQVDARPPAHQNNTGVFLVGKVQRVVPLGELFATEVEMTRGKEKKRVVVVTQERPNLHVHDRAAVLGSLVRDAPVKLAGYDAHQDLADFEADVSQIVLAGGTVKLPEE